MGFGLLNYRWVFSAGRFLQSAVAGGTSNPQLGGPLILERSNSRHKESPASEMTQANPSSGRWNYGREMVENFAESGNLHVIFEFFYMPLNLRHGTDGFTSPPKEGELRIFSLEESDGFGRVWTRELGYQRPARSPVDHRSRYLIIYNIRFFLHIHLSPIKLSELHCFDQISIHDYCPDFFL